MTPTPMTEMAGTAVGEAVGSAGGAVKVAPESVVSVAPTGDVTVALLSWLDASDGEMVCEELKPFPVRTKAPRALLLVSRKAAVGPARI